WSYLGWKIYDSLITPQKLKLHTDISTLHDAQRLLGDLQWFRPIVGFSNDHLEGLCLLLSGTDPATP
ncbi:POK18 protein, partial [Lanius ludovicianus]|nr:POK18 protein [Lanius ludovicianus]